MLPPRMLGLLMLLALLSDVNGMCPTDFEGPILDPPEIIGTYGQSVYVNCSSNSDLIDGIAWKIGNNSLDLQEEIYFLLETVSLTDWSMTAECIIQLNEIHKCSKDLKITVYQNPEVSVSVQEVNVSAEGTLYKVRCDAMNVAPVQNLTVTWHRNNQIITTASFNDTTKTPVNVSSDVLILISRRENVVQIECKAQLDLGLHGPQFPAVSKMNLSALYAPEFILKHNENISVLEGDGVTLNCDAEGNPPPVLHWTHDGVNLLENTSSLEIAYVNTSTTYTCTASNHLGSTTKHVSVHVIRGTTPELPSTTERDCPITVSPAEIVVRFGDPLLITCNTSDARAVKIGWTDRLGVTEMNEPPSITWKVEQMKMWNFNPTCFVNWSDSQCGKRLDVTIYQTPDMVSVSALHLGPVVEGLQHNLTCDIYNVAPVHKLRVTWYRGKEVVLLETFEHWFSVTPVNVSSTLKVTPNRNDNGNVFRCEADLDLRPIVQPKSIHSAASASYTAVVHYAPEFKEVRDNEEVILGKNVTLGCSAEGYPPPEIQWKYISAVNLKETTVGRQKIIMITEATSTNAGVYICVATNEVGRLTRSVTVVVKDTNSTFIWLLIIGCICCLGIFIIVILLCKNSKKHGQYSFVPGNGSDGTDIPMTPKSAGEKA
ncbi:angiopoietin-related protein 6 isoform X2 [Parambassis ranga]|uniref:Angiopoietin-related protein 6 isoform X2 n=1 Tax=Parambassis ranga TaxID=210632 RepID=A0A6P7IUI4_9TELE|nr:vascular cell adhesion protein 1-like isoform X2 [Parambassis ranga]